MRFSTAVQKQEVGLLASCNPFALALLKLKFMRFVNPLTRGARLFHAKGSYTIYL